jgi:hypothetical protein
VQLNVSAHRAVRRAFSGRVACVFDNIESCGTRRRAKKYLAQNLDIETTAFMYSWDVNATESAMRRWCRIDVKRIQVRNRIQTRESA